MNSVRKLDELVCNAGHCADNDNAGPLNEARNFFDVVSVTAGSAAELKDRWYHPLRHSKEEPFGATLSS